MTISTNLAPGHRANGRFEACTRVNGKVKSLGFFDTPEEAHARYQREVERIHGSFARPRG